MSRRLAWAFAALLPVAACAPAMPPPPMPEPAPARPMTPFADGGFGQRAAELNRLIVEASRVAEVRTRNAAVKAQASRLVAAHTADLQSLQQIAGRKGGELPASLTTRAQTEMADLDRAGRLFDHDYLLDMVNAHRDLVSAYQAEMAEGRDPELKGFATANLGPTRRHLMELQRMARRR